MGSGLGVLLEMQFFHFLPSGHDARAAADLDAAPHSVEVLVIDCPNVTGAAGERGQVVALECVIVIRHGVGKAPNYGFSYVCRALVYVEGKRHLELTFVLGLCGSGIASDEVLVVVWT